MTLNEKYDLANWAMQFALQKGAQQVSVSIFSSTNSSVEIRNQKIDKLEQSIQRSLSIKLYVDKRFSTHSTNRIKKDDLTHFITRAIESTRFLAPDEFRTLPNPHLYFKGNSMDLQVNDPQFPSITPEQKIELARQVETEVFGQDERLISVSTSYYDGSNSKVMVCSNGFEGQHQSTYFGLSASVSVKSDDARPEAFWSEGAVSFDKLIKSGIGTKALGRAVQKIGQTKLSSGTFPMLVENRQVGKLLGPLLSAINGASIQQKNSFLMDKLNIKVVSEKVTLIDEPHLASGRASRFFDNEGLATQSRAILSKGVLKTYLLDVYYAQKLNMEPTGGSTTNLVFETGDQTFEELIAGIPYGILVTGFNGGNCNGTTGDFSYGIEGFLIENGKKTQPVSEMNITGNMLELWSNLLALGNDVNENSSLLVPSILFDKVNFSGK